MKKYLKYIVLLGFIGIVTAYYMYNKPHKNMEKAKADYSIEASNLLTAFEADESAANAKYLDKTIEVSGTVREASTDDEGMINVTLDTDNELSGVVCQLDNLTTHKKTTFEPGEKVSFKGICTGMLMDVIIVRCVQTNQS